MSILSFLGLHLVTSCPGFSSFRCLWSFLCSYFSQTVPKFIWKWKPNMLRGNPICSGVSVCLFTYSNEAHKQSNC